ncbi:MAG: hypothetical protein E7454_03735 [Ruminococcaceae bacterium]|nr:hypothetical protein [Oscillospiraceae bacterium]
MDSRKYILKQTAIVALGETLCVGAMVGIYALLNHFSTAVVLGGVVGGVLSVLNYMFMAIGAMIAADKAVEQNVKSGKAIVRMSLIGRLAVMAIVLIAFAKSGLCNLLAMVLPLAFARPILMVADFFGKAGEPSNEPEC